MAFFDQLALFSKTFGAFSLSATVRLAAVGRGWCLRWNWNGAIGPARVSSSSGAGASIGDGALANNTALCFDGKGAFNLVAVGAGVSCHNIAAVWVAFASSGLHSTQDGSDIVVDRALSRRTAACIAAQRRSGRFASR